MEKGQAGKAGKKARQEGKKARRRSDAWVHIVSESICVGRANHVLRPQSDPVPFPVVFEITMRALGGSGTGGVKRGDRRVAHGRVGSSEVSSFDYLPLIL